jgi:DUF1680 family protein
MRTMCRALLVVTILAGFAATVAAAEPPPPETAGGWKKFEGNPIMGGKYGTCFDVAVLREADRYRMWLSWRPKKALALVESQDGLRWSEPPRIVLGPNPQSGWEDDINRPGILKREDGYHLWYTGQVNAGQEKGKSAIGYATSPDGITWKRMSEKPVLSPEKPWEGVAVMCPHVVWDEQTKSYRMWYSAGEQREPDAIGYATSPDGLKWTRYENNPVLRPDPNNDWEKNRVTACQVIRQGDWYVMFYIGFRDPYTAQIGLARSRDGVTNWQRHPANPIIRLGEGKWDEHACYKPFAIYDGRKWLLWYNGRRKDLEQIGVAIHEGEDMGFPAGPAADAGGTGRLTAVPFQDVHVADAFWSPRLETNRKVTIEANLRQSEVTGRIKNFAVAGKLEPGSFQGLRYNDSDVYKVVEGIAYALAGQRDADLEQRADAIIDRIAAAQQPDGYLNTYFTLVKPEDRWKHMQDSHELYCAGHLFEAAVAYYQATGKRKLLDVSCRFADYVDSVFGPDKVQSTSGHEEIELALVKLHGATGNERYLKLAQFFVDVRGRADKRRLYGEYAQDHKPVREQSEVTGHAVRAMYLYCGMADLAARTGDRGLLTALERIWRDVVDRKMYLTGGIGPSASNEGFTVPYDLPNASAYAETCAAVGMALWNHRMFLLSGDGKYADVLEREVYNGLISGVSLSGDRFFYVNPLSTAGNHHRVPWFDTSCCPTNIVRYLPGIGERAYAQRDNALWTVLYLGNTATVALKDGKAKLTQKTRYPWDGDVQITVEPEKNFAFAMHLRVPGWCRSTPGITVNGQALTDIKVDKGFVQIERTWKPGDVVRLHLPMPVERVYADPHVKADVGRVALQRGPVVYCLEGVDNDGSVRNLVLPKDAQLTATFEKDLLGGVALVRGEAQRVSLDDRNELVKRPVRFQAVPYCTWDNRQPGPMVVWVAEQPGLGELPGDEGAVANGVRVRASHLNGTDTLLELNDGNSPKSSDEHGMARMSWWDHKGGTEWVSYRYPTARTFSGCTVYWFDDTGAGQCRVPAEWRLLWLDGTTWKPVKLTEDSSYGTARNAFNKITFEAVATRELKLEVKLQTGFSGGVMKWTVAERE